MKFIALLLSIIVLTLTAVPCCALEREDNHAHKTDKREKHACNEHADDCCKDCSPFYVCGTCIGFTITTRTIITFAIQLLPIQHNTAYIPVELQVIALSIWQPPKLS
ncbi:DUF6660 family protein [Pedobacter suwonensis]|uniref:DUF6660 family protein n=1 Tax=Pedobacter suwonensis TaxID=332999 RepID=UPI0011A4AEC2|nr:DUF6660 family protein [Pedobacter suwonensis]